MGLQRRENGIWHSSRFATIVTLIILFSSHCHNLCGVYVCLIVSQFTLFAYAKGNKCDFHLAMAGEEAHVFFDRFVARVKELSGTPDRVQTGMFGAYMNVETAVDGPVTILLDSKNP